MPGSVVDLMVREQSMDTVSFGKMDRDAVRRALGLDLPVHIQYLHWVRDSVLSGNLGKSLWTNRTVVQDMADRLPVTFELGLLAVITSSIIALPIGIYSAIRQDTWLDYIGRSFSIVCLAAPAFWLATMLIVYGAVYWNWSPAVKYVPFSENPIENLKIIIIPAILVGLASSGAIMRYSRTLMLETLRQDYIRTAWSKGLKERVVVIRHALKNTLIPLITIMAPELSIVIGGSVIMEQIFCLPGMGRYLLEMIRVRDYMLVSGTNLVFATFTMLLILLTDLSYAYFDPRVRYK
jgi:peptide/nickel transport system permease protein